MSLRKTIVLGIVFLGLLLYTVKVEAPREELEQQKNHVFHDLKVGQIKSIEVKSQTEDFELVNEVFGAAPKETETINPRIAAGWGLGDAPGARIEFGALKGLVDALKNLDIAKSVAKEERRELSDYGLEKPELVLTLNLSDGESIISLGKKNNYVSSRYMSLSGQDEVFLTTDDLFNATKKRAIDFRDRTPLEVQEQQLKELKFEYSGQPAIGFVKKDVDSNWYFSEPTQFKASNQKLSALITEYSILRADEYFDNVKSEDLAKYGLDKPDLIISVKVLGGKIGEQSESKVLISKVKESGADQEAYFYVVGTPTVYKTRSKYNPLDGIKAEEFREVEQFKLVANTAKKVTLVKSGDPGSQVSLEKTSEAEWKINGKSASVPFAEEFMRNLIALPAIAFPESENVDFSNPLLTIKVELGQGQDGKLLSQDLLIAGKGKVGDKDGYFAKGTIYNEVFLISDSAFKNLNVDENYFLVPNENESSSKESEES